MQAMGKYSHHLSDTHPVKRRLRKRKAAAATNDQCDEADPMPIRKDAARLRERRGKVVTHAERNQLKSNSRRP